MRFIIFLFLLFSCSKTSETPLARVGSSVLYEKDLVDNHGYKIKTKEKAYDFIENWTKSNRCRLFRGFALKKGARIFL